MLLRLSPNPGSLTIKILKKHDIKSLEIDKNLKSAYLSNKSFGKLKPLTVDVKTKKALTDVFELIRYKSGWKA